MDGKMDNSYDMPMGLSFQLGMNPKAMDVYGKLNDEEKRRVVGKECYHQIRNASDCGRSGTEFLLKKVIDKFPARAYNFKHDGEPHG